MLPSLQQPYKQTNSKRTKKMKRKILPRILCHQQQQNTNSNCSSSSKVMNLMRINTKVVDHHHERQFSIKQSTNLSNHQFLVDSKPLIVDQKVSHIKGPTQHPLTHETLFDLFEKRVYEMDSHPLLQICASEHNLNQEQTFSWREVHDQSLRLANALHRLGYKKEDRIGIWMPNSHEWVIVLMAAAKLGLIVVNVNPAYRKHELQHALNLVQCKGLIIVPEFKGTNYVQMLYDLCPGLDRNVNTNGGKHAYTDGLQVPTVESEALPHLRHIFYCSPSKAFYPGMIDFTNDLLNMPIPKGLTHQQWMKAKHNCNDTLK